MYGSFIVYRIKTSTKGKFTSANNMFKQVAYSEGDSKQKIL